MKLQYEIIKEIVKENKKVTLIYINILLMYYFIAIIFNGGRTEAFNLLFGSTKFENFFSILFFVFHLLYFIYLSYKFATYEVLYMFEEIALRDKYKKFVINKILVIFIYLFTYKLVLYCFFNFLNYCILKCYYFSFSFYIYNFLLFACIFLLTFHFAFIKHKIMNLFIYPFILILAFNFNLITIIIFIAYSIINIYFINFKNISMI